jgi:hypothetical protein
MTNIKSIVSQFGSALGDDVTLKVLTIQDLKCEIVGDRFYFYATEDDTFISHGTSLEEAAESYGKATNNDFVARFTDPTSNTLQYIVNGRITSSVYSPDSHSITNVGEPGA